MAYWATTTLAQERCGWSWLALALDRERRERSGGDNEPRPELRESSWRFTEGPQGSQQGLWETLNLKQPAYFRTSLNLLLANRQSNYNSERGMKSSLKLDWKTSPQNMVGQANSGSGDKGLALCLQDPQTTREPPPNFFRPTQVEAWASRSRDSC